MAELIFWLTFILFFHTWVGYPLTLALLISTNGKGKCKNTPEQENPPHVSVVIPAYNADGRIINKINNILELNYPADRLEIIVVSDGSTDNTTSLAKTVQTPNLFVYELKQNQGKSTAQNYGVVKASFPVILFTDVDSMLRRDALIRMVSCLSDEKVGCVGSRVVYRDSKWETSGSQGLYWRLEQMMRRAESHLGVLTSLTGSAMIVRKSLFRSLDPDTGDDFIIPLDMALAGYQSVLAEDAVVYDEWPGKGINSEIKVRRRFALRNLIGLMRRRPLLNPLRHPMLSFSLISHKVLRWLTPLFMALLLLCSLWLARDFLLYQVLLATQIALYLAALAGVAATSRRIRIPVVGQLGSFLIVNIGMFLGIFGLILGSRIHGYKN